jgi:hypothetical protein
MKTKQKEIPIDYGPETRFDTKPAPPAPFRTELETSFEQLKRRLLTARLDELWEPELNAMARRAANEAAAIAWVTPYPSLFFPALFEEKLQAGVEVAERQAEVSQRSRELLAV